MFLFTVNAENFVLQLYFVFLFKLKVLETRMENIPHIVFRGIFLCYRQGLINIENIKYNA